ncbi:MAG: homoserine O-acetyltransferase [Candidatus Margulisiibacteriota bacterium]
MTKLIIKPNRVTFAAPPDEMVLESGKKLGPITLVYETYGALSPAKDNAVLIFHALSGDQHVAGYHAEADEKPGWWDGMVGSGRAIDTDKYFVICANNIGGCQGSTGPSSINPKTGKPYALDFPVITIGDIVKAQTYLLDHLGIKKVFAATGGSMGGMEAMQLAVAFPDRVENVIPIATTARLSAQNIAFNEVGRRAILHDPNWNGGNYYDKTPPNNGLALARMIGHITYLSNESMHKKFGRELKGEKQFETNFDEAQFQVGNYLRYKGLRFTERFDANSYLYITKAADLFDLADGYPSLKDSLARAKNVKFLVISFGSDWLFPAEQSLVIVDALKDLGAHVSYKHIDSTYGHDAFLLETDELTVAIKGFLDAHYKEKK